MGGTGVLEIDPALITLTGCIPTKRYIQMENLDMSVKCGGTKEANTTFTSSSTRKLDKMVIMNMITPLINGLLRQKKRQ